MTKDAASRWRRLGLDPLPQDPFADALEAYKTRFADSPMIFGIPSARYPELVAELRAAVAGGIPLTDGDIRRALGMSELPPEACS